MAQKSKRVPPESRSLFPALRHVHACKAAFGRALKRLSCLFGGAFLQCIPPPERSLSCWQLQRILAPARLLSKLRPFAKAIYLRKTFALCGVSPCRRAHVGQGSGVCRRFYRRKILLTLYEEKIRRAAVRFRENVMQKDGIIQLFACILHVFYLVFRFKLCYTM